MLFAVVRFLDTGMLSDFSTFCLTPVHQDACRENRKCRIQIWDDSNDSRTDADGFEYRWKHLKFFDFNSDMGPIFGWNILL